MDHRLGKWAVIDIETTGADANYDQVIDLGFLEFEGTKLIKKYSSLVNFEGELSSFIQKLTGINSKMLKKAPSFKSVEGELQELYGHKLIAHNSDFEAGFLQKSFDKIEDGSTREEFVDSLYFLAILFPEYPTLKLEHFIKEWEIRESEVHRGFEDSLDLLKVVLVASAVTKKDKSFYQFLKLQLLEKKFDDFWMMNFLHLDDAELEEIATQIDFNLKESVKLVSEKIWKIRFHENFKEEKRNLNFPLEFSGSNIKDIFSSEEKIQKIFPLYKARTPQIDMALKVGQSFKNNVHSLIQAPTGTGKTFGYLIPSTLFSMQEKKQVLISTGTKTLQHQAFLKDVPKVMEFLGLNSDQVKMKLLVGSSNHLCESLFRQEEQENSLLNLGKSFEELYTSLFFEVIFFHNARVASENKVLRDDLPYVLKRKFLKLSEREKEIAVDFRSCSGSQCPMRTNCSYITGLREAKEANVIIGNHSLMFTWPKGMPRPAHIVVDEAHKIEDEATKSFSLEIEEKSLKNFVNTIGHLQGVGSLFYLLAQNEVNEGESTEVIKTLREESLKAYQMLTDHILPLSESFSLYFKKMPKYTELYWNELPMLDRKTHSDTLALKILAHLESISFIFQTYLGILLPYAGKFDVKNLKNDNEILAFTRFESYFSQVSDYALGFEKLLVPSENYCRSLHFLENEGYILSSAPINIGQIVKDQLLSISQSVVFTSATLANGNGDTGTRGVEWATGYTYLEPERRFKTGFYLPATYDYKLKTKVYLCDDTPVLYDSKFVSTILKEIKPLIYKLNGRSLLLFSAKSRFEEARELLLQEFEGKIPLFIQGMGTNVVEEYKKSEAGILLGMESFGEGIYIPGDNLQFIFIDKIPDLRMDLVINERRNFFEANIGNEFTDYYLSHRTRSLHQKLGRLLRTEDDFGGILIVDSRIKQWKGKTMEKLIKLMEPYELHRAPIKEAVGKIEEFILYQKDHSSI
jgi:ATP-dependent DNA helicase DinG